MVRDAQRNESTLINLENQLRTIKLEEARIEDPWKLITKPQLRKIPVAPNKKRITLIGFFLGIISSSFLMYIKERNSDVIFDYKYIEKLLDLEIITTLLVDKNRKLRENKILNDLAFCSNNKNINFIFIRKTDKEIFTLIRNYFSKNSEIKEKLNFYDDNMQEISKNDKNLLIFDNRKITSIEIFNLKQRLKILDIKIYGIILLN